MHSRRWVGVCRVGDGWVCAGWEMGGRVQGVRWVDVCQVGNGWACAGL